MITALTILAGAVGSVLRFLVDAAFKTRRTTVFPWATAIINTTGSLFLGVLAGLVLFHAHPTAWQAILGTGFCGGYTTFSTASFETVRLLEQRRPLLALVNTIGTLTCTIGACLTGLALVWAL
nr:CrcB family protein [Williamsia sterculiae]